MIERTSASIRNAIKLDENININFGDVQKKTLENIEEESLYTNLGLLLSDWYIIHTLKIYVFEGKDKDRK